MPPWSVGPDYNLGDKKWPSSPKGETVDYFGKDTPTSKDGRKSRALRTTAREGEKRRQGEWGLPGLLKDPGQGWPLSRGSGGGALTTPACKREAATHRARRAPLPSDPRPRWRCPPAPSRSPTANRDPGYLSGCGRGGLHGIPPHGPEDAASPRRPGRAWGRVPCRRTQANARPPPPRPAAPTSNVLRPSVPARRSTGHAAARGTMGLVVPARRKPRSRVWLSSYESRAHSPEVT